jgi:hypothetical protein
VSEFKPDWDMKEAALDSLREHMEIARDLKLENEQLQQQNRELVARVARLERAIRKADKHGLSDYWRGVINKSPQASLAEIEAAGVEKFMQCLYSEYGYEPEDFEEVKRIYIHNLREGK